MTTQNARSVALPTLSTAAILVAGAPALAQAVSPPVAGRADAGAGATPAGAQPLTSQPAGGAPPPQSPFGGSGLLLMMGGFIVLMIVMQTLTGRKEKKRRADMLSSLKRHDRVQTIGGLIGSVAEVRDDEIVLKVDEATNTKVRVVRSAVQTVLKRSPTGADEPALEPARS